MEDNLYWHIRAITELNGVPLAPDLIATITAIADPEKVQVVSNRLGYVTKQSMEAAADTEAGAPEAESAKVAELSDMLVRARVDLADLMARTDFFADNDASPRTASESRGWAEALSEIDTFLGQIHPRLGEYLAAEAAAEAAAAEAAVEPAAEAAAEGL